MKHPTKIRPGRRFAWRAAAAALIAFLSLLPAESWAVQCPNSSPRDSRLWANFESFVYDQYWPGKPRYELRGHTKQLAYGHALGRAASAVGDVHARRVAFACLELAIEQLIAANMFWSPGVLDLSEHKDAYLTIMEAARGMHDDEVWRLTGVKTTSPAERVFAGVAGAQPVPPPGQRSQGGPGPTDRAGTVEAGVDRPGGDYTSFDLPAANPGLCQQRCEGDARCRAWTYVRPGVQGPNARCWLKSTVPPAVARNCCTSGLSGRTVGQGGPGPTNGAGTAEAGVDRPGGDYTSFDLPAANSGLCQQRCEGDARCRAWTYVRPGVQGPNARCWLKSTVPPAVARNCCTSGLSGRTVGQGGPNVVPPGGGARGGGIPGGPQRAKHPWDGMCADKILAAGYRPIFARLTSTWSDLIFADPIDNQYVSVAGCATRQPFDLARFHAEHQEMDTVYPTYAQDPKYFKKVAYRHRTNYNWITFAYFRK